MSSCVDFVGKYIRRQSYLLQDFLPDIVGPMRSNRCEQKGLKFNITVNKVTVHACASCCCHFPIKVSCSCEVVKSGFESKLIVRPSQVVRLVFGSLEEQLTLRSAPQLQPPGHSSHYRRPHPNRYERDCPISKTYLP